MSLKLIPPRIARIVGSVLLLAYLGAAFFLFFWPNGGRIHRINLDFWWKVRTLLGNPPGFGPDQAEILANGIVFFIPVLAFCIIFYKAKPWFWTLLAILASAGIEITQGLVLPHRRLDLTDFLSNSAGAVLGGVVGVVILRFMALRDVPSPQDHSVTD